MTVNAFWIEVPLGVDHAQPNAPLADWFANRNSAIEAGPPPRVATGLRSRHLDLEQEGVLVAVGAKLDHALGIAARLALAPQLAARARPVVRFAGLDGERERLGVPVGKHQDFAGRGRSRDHGDEPVLVEAGSEHAPFLDF